MAVTFLTNFTSFIFFSVCIYRNFSCFPLPYMNQKNRHKIFISKTKKLFNFTPLQYRTNSLVSLKAREKRTKIFLIMKFSQKILVFLVSMQAEVFLLFCGSLLKLYKHTHTHTQCVWFNKFHAPPKGTTYVRFIEFLVWEVFVYNSRRRKSNI